MDVIHQHKFKLKLIYGKTLRELEAKCSCAEIKK